jgi:signal peptidase II
MSPVKSRAGYLLVTLVLLVVDQATKFWAMVSLRPRIFIEVVPGFFRLSYATNRGVAFSLFADSQAEIRYLLAAFSLVAALLVAGFQWRTPTGHRRLQSAFSLMLAGILGNLIDRIRLGEVVDFLDFHIMDRYAWPTFNVADTAICIGAGLVALDIILEEREARRYVS